MKGYFFCSCSMIEDRIWNSSSDYFHLSAPVGRAERSRRKRISLLESLSSYCFPVFLSPILRTLIIIPLLFLFFSLYCSCNKQWLQKEQFQYQKGRKSRNQEFNLFSLPKIISLIPINNFCVIHPFFNITFLAHWLKLIYFTLVLIIEQTRISLTDFPQSRQPGVTLGFEKILHWTSPPHHVL